MIRRKLSALALLAISVCFAGACTRRAVGRLTGEEDARRAAQSGTGIVLQLPVKWRSSVVRSELNTISVRDDTGAEVGMLKVTRRIAAFDRSIEDQLTLNTRNILKNKLRDPDCFIEAVYIPQKFRSNTYFGVNYTRKDTKHWEGVVVVGYLLVQVRFSFRGDADLIRSIISSIAAEV
jgi:hypothetical protein